MSKRKEHYSAKGTYAGYDKNFDSTQKDSYGIIDFGKDINITLETEKTFSSD